MHEKEREGGEGGGGVADQLEPGGRHLAAACGCCSRKVPWPQLLPAAEAKAHTLMATAAAARAVTSVLS